MPNVKEKAPDVQEQKAHGYILVKIPTINIQFDDYLLNEHFHQRPNRLNSTFMDDLTKHLEEHFANVVVTISQ